MTSVLNPAEAEYFGYLNTELAERSLREFVRQAWPVVDPSTPFIPNWHLDAMCDHLQAITEGKLQRLVINVPPGSAKSIICLVMWPAFEWVQNPALRYLTASHGADLATRDAVRTRRLMASDWYQTRWGSRFRFTTDQNQKQRYENDKSGYRVAIGVGAGLGERADRILVDDPLKTTEASSDTERENANRWWRETMTMRANDMSTAAWVIVMQRLHEDDLSGEMLKGGGYEHLRLPMRFEASSPCTTKIGFVDPRIVDGELLFPRRWPESEVQNLEKGFGPAASAGQLQQRPSPAGGGIIKRHWWKYWRPAGSDMLPVKVTMPSGEIMDVPAVPLPVLTEEFQSWDMAFKATKTSDFVCGGAWGKRGADRFLLHLINDRLDFPATKAAVREMTEKFPRAVLKLVEDKANGSAIIAELKHEITGLMPVEPMGGKVARAQAVTPQIAAGNVYLPHPDIAPWVSLFIEQAASFPNGAHDDMVDMATMALARSKGGLIFPMKVEDVICTPFEIPATWPRAYGLVTSGGATGVVWIAHDKQNHVFYVYREYFREGADIGVHADAVKRPGTWIPGTMGPATSRNSVERDQIMRKYRLLGLRLNEVPGTDAAIEPTWAALQAGELKAFSTLTRWREQFVLFRTDENEKVVAENHQLMAAMCECFGTGKERFTTEPSSKRAAPSPIGDRGWMS